MPGTFHGAQNLARRCVNDTPKAFVWKATADVILDKVRRCRELAGTTH